MPVFAAQEVADKLVDAEVMAILNFAPVTLELPCASPCATSTSSRNSRFSRFICRSGQETLKAE